MSVCDFSAGGQRADSESGGKTSTADSGMSVHQVELGFAKVKTVCLQAADSNDLLNTVCKFTQSRQTNQAYDICTSCSHSTS